MSTMQKIQTVRAGLLAVGGAVALLMAVGCSGMGTAAGGPSAVAGGGGSSTFGPLDTAGPSPVNLPPLGGVGLSCPSDAPAPVRANAQGQIRPDGRDAVLIDWRAVSGRVYEVEVDRYEVTNAYAPSARFNTETNQDTRAYGPGRYRARVRSRAAGLCGTPGGWSSYVAFSVEPGVERTPVVPAPPACGNYDSFGVCEE